MFTSRAEHRLVLREDNVWERLYSLAARLKILSPEREQKIYEILERREKLLSYISSQKLFPDKKTQSNLKRWAASLY